MEKLNPDDFIITRKRKLYKFAVFANSALCFEAAEWVRDDHVANIMELGAGTGLFSVALAQNNAAMNILAVDVKADRLQTGAGIAQEQGLSNIEFMRARANQLPELLTPHSLTSIWITFPDPFPKERSARRRLTHAYYLEQYAQLLTPEGSLYLKHDNREFFNWSLEQLVAAGWHIDELSFDLHESELSDEYKVQTTYEKRWLGEGLSTHFVKATPGKAIA